LDGFDIPFSDFERHFNPFAERFQIKYHLALTDYRPKIVILVSAYHHCLADLLYRHSTGELACDIVMIMQILGPDFVAQYLLRMINIHHSFLPALVGAKPYHQAFERGVKLIGASSHYVTATLDEGPIIEQDVVRVSHRDTIDDMLNKGRDLEKVVLSRAVRWHLENSKCGRRSASPRRTVAWSDRQ